MHIKFWGTRGSLPRATNHQEILNILKDLDKEAAQKGLHKMSDIISSVEKGELTSPLSYGGDTTCVEIGDGSNTLYVDMGSGLRAAGTYAMEQGTKEFNIFLTHMHWDHVIGIPFFRPIFAKGYKLNIYHIHDKSPEFVKLNFNGINFPILWNDLESEIHFHKMTPYKETKLGDMSITPFTLDHPGHSYGYRVESKGKSVAIGFDSEYSRMSKEDMGDDLKFYQNLDLLIFDGQYSEEELKSRKGWGHSTPTIGTEIALREGIKNIAFTHHDPWSKKDKLQSMHQDAENYKKANLGKYKSNWSKQPEGPNLIYAYDQLDIKV